MSLFTEYLATVAATSAKVESDRLDAVAQAKEAVKALELQRMADEYRVLEEAGLVSDFTDLSDTYSEIKEQKKLAQTEVDKYQLIAIEAQIASDLVEAKAKAVESLITEMETQGLLADQLEATKQNHLDSALASHNAAKAAKERVARLLANKKIK